MATKRSMARKIARRIIERNKKAVQKQIEVAADAAARAKLKARDKMQSEHRCPCCGNIANGQPVRNVNGKWTYLCLEAKRAMSIEVRENLIAKKAREEEDYKKWKEAKDKEARFRARRAKENQRDEEEATTFVPTQARTQRVYPVRAEVEQSRTVKATAERLDRKALN